MAGTATNDVLSLLVGAVLLLLMGLVWRWLHRMFGDRSGSSILMFSVKLVPIYFAIAGLLVLLALVRLGVAVASGT